MKKTLALLLASLAVAGFATAASAEAEVWQENVDYIVHGEMNHPNYPGSVATGLPEVTTGQLLKGTVISSLKAFEGTEELPLSICDADATTSYSVLDGEWIGIIFDQPYQLTEVRAVPNPNLTSEELGGFRLQGSNDGKSWVNVVNFGQVAHGNDYHIFTPQPVTDQRYIDAGYSTRTDESIHWVDNGGSYQYYRMLDNVIADVEFYGNPAPATELSRDIVSIRDISTYNYFDNNYFIRTGDEIKNSVDGSLVGTIIAGSSVFNKALYDKAFDGNTRTHYDTIAEGPRCWVGMMFDEPHALTEVRILPKRGGYTNVQYGRFQGSFDGHNWIDIIEYGPEDIPTKQDWIIKTVSMDKGYTHYRYTTDEQMQASLAELLLFGAPAEAADPFTVEPLIATRYTYSGEIFLFDGKNTVSGNEISGTPACGRFFDGWIDYGRGIEKAFDGDTSTYYGTISGYNGSQFWVGLKADEATALSTARFFSPRCETFKTLYFQGSVDGHTWVDLAEVKPSSDAVDADGWITKTITDTTVYSYFRLMNDSYDHPYSSIEVNEMKLYAAAAQAPETTAPETAAPETTAPEIVVPETTAPEGEAPSAGTDTPVAPQTFDMGVIAAAAAVLSAAGYAIARKRK